MTTAFTPTPSTGNLPTLPDGWPIGSYDTYSEAQRAVDHLADENFPVQEVTIVGVEPMVVERVAARLTWGRVLGGGAASGAWLGLFVGLLLSLFTPGAGFAPILIGLGSGVVFGVASAAMRYGATRGQRDFVSHSQLVARRYDVLCKPRHAEQGRDLLARLAMRPAGIA
ncbi:MAG TPA: general stress protein [Actinophytocola sp.]|nr:general stress protein [Actinophytocola sp.]